MPKIKEKRDEESDDKKRKGSAVNLRAQIEKLGALLIDHEDIAHKGGLRLLTGILPLDLALTPDIGFCRGCAEIYGPEGVGKTSLVMSLLRSAKESNVPAFMLDVENSLTDELCGIFGLKPNVDFLLSQPDSAEATLNSAEMFLRNTKGGVLIIDSIANLLSKGEMEEKAEDKSFNPVSLMLSKFAKKAPVLTRQQDCLVIYLNQIRDSMDKYGPQIRTPGPKAIRFNTQWRVEMKRVGLIKESSDDGEVIGQKVEMKTIKNKYAKPFQRTQSNLIFGKGFHQGYDLIELAQAFGIKDLVSINASWITFYDGNKVQGLAAAADYIVENKEVLRTIRDKVIEVCRS